MLKAPIHVGNVLLSTPTGNDFQSWNSLFSEFAANPHISGNYFFHLLLSTMAEHRSFTACLTCLGFDAFTRKLLDNQGMHTIHDQLTFPSQISTRWSSTSPGGNQGRRTSKKTKIMCPSQGFHTLQLGRSRLSALERTTASFAAMVQTLLTLTNARSRTSSTG